MEDLLIKAVRNNVHWCDFVVRKKENSTLFTSLSWHTTQPVPENYPNLITLKSNLTDEEKGSINKTIDSIPLEKFSIKDSFSELDIEKSDFIILFTASWIAFTEKGSQTRTNLENWQHEEEVDADVNYVVKLDKGKPISGFITNIFDETIGVTNVFYDSKNKDFWNECVGYIRKNISDLPIVGYEKGQELELAVKSGFKNLGELRVLSIGITR